ncbi:hypothetical protein F2P79_013019 [Pimephales promelas]|nr:hypothetical protein F2P79_013019 [Pimephales promelas]
MYVVYSSTETHCVPPYSASVDSRSDPSERPADSEGENSRLEHSHVGSVNLAEAKDDGRRTFRITLY